MPQTMTKTAWRRVLHSIVAGADLHHLHPKARAASMTELHEEHARWFRDPNVVGVAAGPTFRHGRPAGRGIQVYVRRKLPLEDVAAEARIPERIGARGLGVRGALKTDVQAVGDPRPQSLFVSKRPALPGFNVGDAAGSSGTFGCLVRDRKSGELLGLSCAHVLASTGSAGGPIFVPSTSTSPNAPQIGTLAQVAPVGFTAAAAATNIDAATFRPDDPHDVSDFIARLGQAPEGIKTGVREGLSVTKVGAISDQTFGVIQSTTANVKMTLADATGAVGDAIFIDQIGVSSFTSDGDSGSLVLSKDENLAVGLHFFATSTLSVCQPIRRVLDALSCDLA